ncbi:hypothetical protein SROCM77S_00408 [Streptomyces rochei]
MFRPRFDRWKSPTTATPIRPAIARAEAVPIDGPTWKPATCLIWNGLLARGVAPTSRATACARSRSSSMMPALETHRTLRGVRSWRTLATPWNVALSATPGATRESERYGPPS